MEITTTRLKRCDLVKVSGRIDSYTAPQLTEALNALLGERRYKIVLELSELESMSSAGLRVLISTQKTCRRYNRGEVVIAQPQPRIREVIELAGFLPLFKVFDDVTLAVGYF